MFSRARQEINQHSTHQASFTSGTIKKYLTTALLSFLALFAFFALLALTAVSVRAATLTSIAVTPANPTINVGQTQQFTATGTFSDGTSRPLDTWVGMPPMSTPRVGHAAGMVNGILYVVGGFNGSSGITVATMEAYDPAANTWTTKAPMPTARYGHAVGGGKRHTLCGGRHIRHISRSLQSSD